MSRLITVFPPHVAVADAVGVSSYRTQIVSLEVAQRDDGTTVLTLGVGRDEASMVLTPELRAHLISLLGEARP